MADFSVQDNYNVQKAFTNVTFAAGARLMETELNELQKIQSGLLASFIRQLTYSGVLQHTAVVGSNVDTAEDGQFTTSATANTIGLGKFVGLVNGYLLPIYNTAKNNNAHVITFSSPPTEGTRYDMAFLEAWMEEIDYTETIKKYGGVDNELIANDILDNRYSRESTRRTQLKWRIRKVGAIDFATYPLGMTDPNISAWAGNGAMTMFAFSQSATDPKLFVAGDGSTAAKSQLNTVSGYSYAIPLIKVLRRTNVTEILSTDMTDLRNTIYTLNSVKSKLNSLQSLIDAGTFVRKDGTVAMTGTLELVPGINANHALTKQQVEDEAFINALIFGG